MRVGEQGDCCYFFNYGAEPINIGPFRTGLLFLNGNESLHPCGGAIAALMPAP